MHVGSFGTAAEGAAYVLAIVHDQRNVRVCQRSGPVSDLSLPKLRHFKRWAERRVYRGISMRHGNTHSYQL